MVAAVESLTKILPWFNDITSNYGEPILHLLEDAVPYIHWLAQDVPALQSYARLAPAISWALRKFGKSGRLAVNYFPRSSDSISLTPNEFVHCSMRPSSPAVSTFTARLSRVHVSTTETARQR